MELWAVKLGSSFLLAALLVLASAWLPLGLASTLAAQEKDSETETTVAPNTTPFPYSALHACNVGIELSAGEGCHVSATGTSFVVGPGSGCIVLFEPSLLAICHAAATDSSSVLSASKGADGSWTIEELADAPDGCGELTDLHEAVRLGNAEWVACLAETGAEVNARDERAEAFTSYLLAGVYGYSYMARATTPGTFVAPSAKAKEMYAPETFGRSGTDWVVVEVDQK